MMGNRPWRIRYKELDFTEDDLLAGDLSACQTLVGAGWVSCDPWAGPTQLSTMLYVVGCRLRGLDGDEAVDYLREISSLSGADLVGTITARDTAL